MNRLISPFCLCTETTIIESLKYGITGGMPPGAKAGQSFVHDPRSVGQHVVKASVKLRFTSKAGQGMVVVRSMELTQKKTTASFKQLDGVLRTIDPRTGERKSLSHKCSELDRQVPQLLGVSKAILEHVLFCHQEDSSWPLQEGAVLKKRFDEIFDSSRYSKAIEVFRKKEKAYISLAKDIKADVASLNSHKHAAQGFRKELDDANEVLDEIDETKSELKKEMAETDRLMAEANAIIEQIDAVDDEIKSREDERYRQQAVVGKARDMLEEDYTATKSLADLNRELTEFGENMSSQLDELKDLEEQHGRKLRDIERLRQEEIKLSNDMTKFDIENEAQQERLRRRYSLMESIAQTHSLAFELSQTQADQSFAASMTASMISQTGGIGSQDTVISITAEDMQSFFEALEKKENELSSRLNDLKKRTKAADDDLHAVLQDLSGRMKVVKTGKY